MQTGQSTPPMSTLYRTPLTPSYWKEASASSRSLRNLAIISLMVALSLILGNYEIYLTPSLRISFTFLPMSICALIVGPIGMIPFSVVEDTLGFFLSNARGDSYFPGYMLSTLLSCWVYAFFFYRTRLSITRLAMAKLLVNLINIFVGSIWRTMLYSGEYWAYVSVSAWKNLLLLLPEILLLALLFQALVPIFQRAHLIPKQLEGKLPLI